MTRTPITLRFALISFFLLAFGGVGVGATDVGASGGYGTANYRYTFANCSGGTTTRTNYTGSQRYRAHFQTDLPGDTSSLGVEAGLTLVDQWSFDSSVNPEVDPDTGEERLLTSSEQNHHREARVHVIPKMGIHGQFLDGTFGLGVSFAAGPNGAGSPIYPAMMYELRTGYLGYAGYYGRGELITFYAPDWSMAHGVTFGGGDRPSGHVAARFSQFVQQDAVMTWIEGGFESPRHWVVRPALRAGVAPNRDLSLFSFDVHASVSVVLGKKRRAKHSEKWRDPLMDPQFEDWDELYPPEGEEGEPVSSR